MVATENVKKLSDQVTELIYLLTELRVLRFRNRQHSELYALLNEFHARITADLTELTLRLRELKGEVSHQGSDERHAGHDDRLELYRAGRVSVAEKLDKFLEWHDEDSARTRELFEAFVKEQDVTTRTVLLLVDIHLVEGLEKLALLSVDPNFRSS